MKNNLKALNIILMLGLTLMCFNLYGDFSNILSNDIEFKFDDYLNLFFSGFFFIFTVLVLVRNSLGYIGFLALGFLSSVQLSVIPYNFDFFPISFYFSQSAGGFTMTINILALILSIFVLNEYMEEIKGKKLKENAE